MNYSLNFNSANLTFALGMISPVGLGWCCLDDAIADGIGTTG